ncbi:hypothetical protein OOK44_36375 [Streptomyces cellulosae]|uniref:Uncharacterized protein n=1 Tax=Streptomyces althioticus TaxID=83380 RepID=A0ABZ1YFH3_9ACTN|nr:hypothetical protein [Streptomyces sp.]MCX4481856.1 hypothetical protein [Streptomyces cellulosae]WTB86663.1 hypothetical protein OG837_35905 [Streptomyces cellulosae]WTB93481.1 hypothetical protein OIE99_35125 [Streptomyces cellulosae]WTC60872.1 hypothetical protein OH715_36875 [Streptomyces cellulosae]
MQHLMPSGSRLYALFNGTTAAGGTPQASTTERTRTSGLRAMGGGR